MSEPKQSHQSLQIPENTTVQPSSAQASPRTFQRPPSSANDVLHQQVGRRRSRVWKYFIMVDTWHYTCRLCRFVGVYTNTTNMRKHIQNHHPEIYQDILDHTLPTGAPLIRHHMTHQSYPHLYQNHLPVQQYNQMDDDEWISKYELSNKDSLINQIPIKKRVGADFSSNYQRQMNVKTIKDDQEVSTIISKRNSDFIDPNRSNNKARELPKLVDTKLFLSPNGQHPHYNKLDQPICYDLCSGKFSILSFH